MVDGEIPQVLHACVIAVRVRGRRTPTKGAICTAGWWVQIRVPVKRDNEEKNAFRWCGRMVTEGGYRRVSG